MLCEYGEKKNDPYILNFAINKYQQVEYCLKMLFYTLFYVVLMQSVVYRTNCIKVGKRVNNYLTEENILSCCSFYEMIGLYLTSLFFCVNRDILLFSLILWEEIYVSY